MSPRFSFIVPFHSGLAHLDRCLDAIVPLSADSELIIAADGAVDDCTSLALRYGARVVPIPGPAGPASARNAAATTAQGDVLVFIDADVIVARTGLIRLRTLLAARPDVTAVFGAYDDQPRDRGFMSQYKNLAHAFVHRTSASNAQTFWAGFGAIRREAFQRIGGFDERFERPSVEDIELGYRLTAAGYAVVLDSQLSASHLKQWTVASAIVSDVRDRGIPWTQLIWRYRALHDDLNLRTEYRWSALLAYLFSGLLLGALYDRRVLFVSALLLMAMTTVNRRELRFFYEKRGAWFTARVWLLRIVQDLCNGVSFAVGTCLFLCARYLGICLPGALPANSWLGRDPQIERPLAAESPVS